MFSRRWIVVPVVAALMVGGCDRLKRSSNSSDSSSTAGAGDPPPGVVPGGTEFSASIPATFPAEFRSLTVTENETSSQYEFPEAHLHIDRKNQELALYSQAKDPENTGVHSALDGANSYYISLAIDDFDDFAQQFDANQLAKFELRAKPSADEFDDSSLDGIYLGQRYRLQSSQGVLHFEREGQSLRVVISGTFLKFDTEDDSRTGVMVKVEGTLMVIVDR